MSFASDVSRDLELVFFAGEALSCLLVRKADSVDVVPTGFRCHVLAGLERFTNEGYIKNSWEVTVKVSDRILKGDLIQVLDDDGIVVEHYLVGELAQRDGDVLIFVVDKQRIESTEDILPDHAVLHIGKALIVDGKHLVNGV
jgi:hypothetical protein